MSRGKITAVRTFVVATGTFTDNRTEEYSGSFPATVVVSTAHGTVPTATENCCEVKVVVVSFGVGNYFRAGCFKYPVMVELVVFVICLESVDVEVFT